MTLVDTGPLVALCDQREPTHASALRQLSVLASSRQLAVCEAVLAEACFHLPAAFLRERLQGFCLDFGIDTVGTFEGSFRSDVFAWLARYSDHTPDWADACLAVLASRPPMPSVWTYDHEFRTIWRRLDGTPIPLATRV